MGKKIKNVIQYTYRIFSRKLPAFKKTEIRQLGAFDQLRTSSMANNTIVLYTIYIYSIYISGPDSLTRWI